MAVKDNAATAQRLLEDVQREGTGLLDRLDSRADNLPDGGAALDRALLSRRAALMARRELGADGERTLLDLFLIRKPACDVGSDLSMRPDRIEIPPRSLLALTEDE